MNKGDLIKVFLKNGYSGAESKRIVDTFIESITESLVNGENVTLTGFGTFRKAEIPETTRKVFNEEKTIPAHLTVRFKAGAILKERVNAKE